MANADIGSLVETARIFNEKLRKLGKAAEDAGGAIASAARFIRIGMSRKARAAFVLKRGIGGTRNHKGGRL